jgi:hypothetical protein
MQAEALVFTEADLRRLVVSQLEEIEALREELGTLREEAARERAYDRQRLSKLENRNKTVTSDTGAAYADKLHKLMLQSGTRQISVSNAAKLLGVSRMHAHRLKPLIASDPRFAIVKDPKHKQRHLIRITREVKL